MTNPTPLVFNDELIERMLIQRAGSAAPIDLVSDIVTSIRTASQRRSGPRPLVGLSRRGRLLLVAATLTVAGGSAALMGSGLVWPTQPTPSPAPTASGEPSVNPSLAPSGSPPSDAFAAFPGLFGDVDPYQYRLVSETVGWVAMANLNGSTPAALYRTEDAGRTWTSVPLPEGGTFAAGRAGVALVDADTVVAVFGKSPTLRIVATHDGGASWTTATIGDPILSTGTGPALWFRSPTIGTATFQDGDLKPRLAAFATTDGGVTWGERRDGTVPGEPFPFKLGVEARPGPHGFLSVDWSEPAGTLIASIDGGATWRRLGRPWSSTGSTAGDPIGTPWIGDDGHIAFAAAVESKTDSKRHDALFESTDDGRTWRTVREWPLGTLEDAQPWSATEWMLIGHDHAAFWSTTDGGNSWRDVTGQPLASPTWTYTFGSPDVGWSLYRCAFVRERPDPYCGSNPSGLSVLIVTRDGGRTWTPIGE
jgi:photosystem II stability/assembly factor-like uncharacterized protein